MQLTRGYQKVIHYFIWNVLAIRQYNLGYSNDFPTKDLETVASAILL